MKYISELNLYCYVLDNPVTYIDLFGLRNVDFSEKGKNKLTQSASNKFLLFTLKSLSLKDLIKNVIIWIFLFLFIKLLDTHIQSYVKISRFCEVLIFCLLLINLTALCIFRNKPKIIIIIKFILILLLIFYISLVFQIIPENDLMYKTHPRFLVSRANAELWLLKRKLSNNPTEPEIKRLITENKIIDPFTKKEFNLIINNSDEIVVYSIGPDKKDQNALITYDPTNGTISEGDIFIVVGENNK